MSARELAAEIVSNYERHGWKLRRLLLRPETRIELLAQTFDEATMIESDFDGLWFARPSHEKREAWELRLVNDPPYALFELFEPDELEDDREDVRREMEAKIKEVQSDE